MPLAETAQLLLKMVLQDQTSATAKKVQLSIGDIGKTAVLAGGAAGFGALTKGALDAQAAQGKFMAATGATRAEAEKFVSGMDSLAGSAGAVGVSFDEITQVGSTVAQQFGTSGQATTDLTGKILELAKVSGGDANDQANALGDTLSGMGLDASAAGAVMDNLVASNQQFGTSIGDSITALDNMTPALSALGLSLADGQGLLNAFEQANVDASTASGDLTKAIKNLKPGQNIDDLVKQVGAIEDPILRAKEATKLFGKAAGPDMAKVIQPGMQSLKDVELQAKDTSGSLDGAANDMLTDADKIKGIFDKIGAGAREMGQSLGPGITALGTLGSAFGALAKTLKLDKFTGVLKDKLGAAIGAAWEGAQNLASSAYQLAADAASAAYQKALDVAQAVKFKLQDAWDAAKSVASRAIGAAAEAASAAYKAALKIGGAIADALGTAWDAAKSVARRAIGVAATAAAAAYSAALKLGSAIADALGPAWDLAKTAASRTIELAGAAAGAAYSAAVKVGTVIADAVSGAWDAIMGSDAVRKVIEKVGGIAGGIYAGAVAVVEKLTTLISGAWAAVGGPASNVIKAATAAGEAAGASWSLGVVTTIGTLGLAAIGKILTDALAGNAKPGGANFADNYLQGLKDKAAQGAPAVGTEVGTTVGTSAGAAVGPAITASVNYVPFIQTSRAAGAAAAQAAGDGASEAGTKVWPAVATDWAGAAEVAMERQQGPLNRAGIKFADHVTGPMKGELITTAAEAAAATAHSYNEKILSERGQAQDAWTAFVNMMKHPLDTAAELAKLKGELASKKMLEGLNSKDPQVRLWAENTRDAIDTRIGDLEHLLGQDGAQASRALETNLSSKYAEMKQQASRLVGSLNQIFTDLKTHYTIRVDAAGNAHGGNPGVPHGVPRYAEGGHYRAGEPRIVGEKGPELDIPDGSGTIVPAHKFASTWGQSLNVAVSVNFSTREMTEQQKHYAAVQGVARTFR